MNRKLSNDVLRIAATQKAAQIRMKNMDADCWYPSKEWDAETGCPHNVLQYKKQRCILVLQGGVRCCKKPRNVEG